MVGRAVLVAMLVVATVAAGCGSAPGRTTTSVAPEDTVEPVTLSITEPDAETVPARVADGVWTANVTVAGRSQPGSLVRVSTGCRRPSCLLSAQADGEGLWRVRLRAEATPAKPYARIVAELAGQSALTLVKLEPAAKRTTTKRSARRGKRAARNNARKHRGTGGAAAPANREGTEGVPVPPPPATLPAPASGDAATPDPVTPGKSRGPASSLLMVGDSLAVGTQPLLAGYLPGWSVATDARQDRTLAQGMARWRLEKGNAVVNAFSLFTNDDPGNVAALEAAVRESAAEGCAVWATIVRPPQRRVSYAKANATLERLAAEMPGRVVVVPWADVVREHPEYLTSDRVHATAAGYRARAQLYAQAAQSCV